MVIFLVYSFDEIMAYHPDNADVYQEIKQFLPRLVPFIGAGLTQFAYCSWPDALKALSGKLTNDANVQKITGLINSKHYLDAAQKLEDFRTPTNLARDLAGIFSAVRLEQKREQLPKESIFLLPYLFPDLVLTTNFDETLETVYREGGHPFQTTFLPGHPELLRQLMLKGGVRGLFKLHGTVTGGLIEYEKIVFTQAQYDRHYGKASPLTRELKACFKNRMMLFLGCSLESDRTMELLQEVIQPGDSYYTVISCEPSERDEKVKQLGKRRIRAILYEKDRHEAVRVILEHLLEEMDPESYNALPVHVGALKSIDLSERFSPKAEIVPFTGRADELQALNTFLGDAHIAFRWWAITGPGGSGKSRLAYEFQKQLPPDWAVHYIDSGDYADLFSLTTKLTQKTLLIADYVQENAKEIGRWMEQTNQRKRSLPIRVLLVERESSTNDVDSGWIKQLYANVRHEQKLKSACYRRDFLVLPPLGDHDLLDIIGNYASAISQNSGHADHMLPNTVKQLLLQKLRFIDPQFHRPLYALFLTDAFVMGNNPEQWEHNDILDYVTEREQKRLEFNLQQTLGRRDEKLYTACLYLYSMATVLQDASWEELQSLCPDTCDIIKIKADSFESPTDMLEQAGLVVKGTVFALRPDLIGEYFVYIWLLRHPNKAQQFLYATWQKPATTAVFFSWIFHDYSYLLNQNAKHWELIIPNDIPASEDTAWFYAALLVNMLHFCSITEECERQINLLEELVSVYPTNSGITIEFAKGLVNLSNKQDEQGACVTIERLECLVAEHPDVSDIVIALANGLFSLSNKQGEQSAQATIERLKYLATEYPDVSDIVITLAKGLVNLSNKQDEQGAQVTIEHLERLTAEHPDVPEIVIVLANGLANFINKQDEQRARVTIERLEHLISKHPDVTNIAIEFAKGLVNLSCKQNEQGAQVTIERLEHLMTEHPDMPDITIAYAKGLANLSKKQDEQGAQVTIECLEHLMTEHPDMPDIVIAYARGLINLSNKQDEQDVRVTIERLEHCITKHPYSPDIAIEFAKGLVNLSYRYDEQGTQGIIDRLKRLAAEYPDVPDIAISLAKGLFNLSNKQDEQGAQNTIKRLGRLAAEHPDIPDIAIIYAKNLVNLSCEQDEQEAQNTIKRLECLAAEHSGVLDIAGELAKGLVNLSNKQDEERVRDTVGRLERLAAEHPDAPDIVIKFAASLVNLSYRQDEQGSQGILKRLECLTSEHPEVPDIAIMLAMSLFNLSNKQDEQGAQNTIKRLGHLAAEHPDIPDIAIIYAKNLVNLSCEQDEQEAQDTIKRLERLAAEHPGVLDIAGEFAKGLVNLSNKQDEERARDTVGRLERLAAEHPDVPDIVIAFIKGLAILNYKQDKKNNGSP